MRPFISLTARVFSMIIAAVVITMLGFVYVNVMGIGWRAAVVMHGGVLAFFACMIYQNNLRLFLVFCLVFAVSLQIHYYILHRPVTWIESQPFVSGITIDSVDLLLMLLYGQWFVELSRRKTVAGFTLGRPVGAVFLSWIAVCLVCSLISARELQYSIYETIVLIKGFFLYLYLVNNIRTRLDLQVVVYSLMASTVVHALYTMLQYATRSNYTLHGQLVRGIRGGYEGFRAVGFSGSWDGAAAMFSFIFPIFLTYFLMIEGRAKRLLALGSVAIILGGFFCLKVRAGYIAIACSSFLVIMLSYFRSHVSIIRFQRMLIAGIVAAAAVSPLIVMRFLRGTAGEDRFPLMQMAMEMIKANWLFGVGLNNFAFNIEEYLTPQLRYVWAYLVHNEYLMRLAETGIFGFSLYYSLMILAMVLLWKVSKSKDTWLSLVSLGLFCAFVGSILPRLVSFFHYLGLYLQLSTILAVTQIVWNMENRRSVQAGYVADSETTARVLQGSNA